MEIQLPGNIWKYRICNRRRIYWGDSAHSLSLEVLVLFQKAQPVSSFLSEVSQLYKMIIINYCLEFGLS